MVSACVTFLLCVVLSVNGDQSLNEALRESNRAGIPFSERPILALCSTSNSPRPEWQLKLTHLIKETLVHVTELPCAVSSTPEAAIVDVEGNHHLIVKEEDQEMHAFTDNVLLKLCARWLNVLHNISDYHRLVSSKPQDILIAVIRNNSYTEHTAFLQAVLSTSDIANTLSIAVTSSSNILPGVARTRKSSPPLQLWSIRDGQWTRILFKSEGNSEGLRKELVSYIHRMQYPATVVFSGVDYHSVYNGSGLRLLLMFHHTAQYNEILTKTILPLAAKFRAHFGFVTIDGDVYDHEKRKHYVLNTPLPYIIILEPGKTSGIHVESKNIPFTISSLSAFLDSIVDPTVNNVEPAPPENGIEVSFTDPKTLGLLSKSVKSPILAAFCAQGSSECRELYMKLQKAVETVKEVSSSLNINLYVVECENIEQAKEFDVDSFPGASFFSPAPHERIWWPIQDNITVAKFLAIIQLHGTSSDEDKTKPLDPTHFIDEIYGSEELSEDEAVILLYKSLPAIPSSLVHLTTDNHSSFFETVSPAIVGFYYHYCVPCLLLLLHLEQAQTKLKEAGVSTAVVHCADYPDVCNAHDAMKYPTLMYRKADGSWTEYTGVINSQEIYKLFDLKKPDLSSPLIELTPALLPRVLSQSDQSKPLVLLCADELSDWLNALVSDLGQGTIYWLNSTKYHYVSKRLLSGTSLPVLLLLNFQNRGLHKLELSQSMNAADVTTFVSQVVSGAKTGETTLEWMSWPPKRPHIQFPSSAFNHSTGKEHLQVGSDSSKEEFLGMDDDHTSNSAYYDNEEEEEVEWNEGAEESATHQQHQHEHTEL